MKATGEKERPPGKLWVFLNSPLLLLLLSSVIIGGGAKIYTDRQAAAADLETRRSQYVEMLAEYQHRISDLVHVDSELDAFIGEGVKFETKEPLTNKRHREFETASERVGKQEADILAGRGTYVATAPAFANMSLLSLTARMERLAGIPDLQFGSLRLLSTLDVPPDVLWLFVRSYLPMMMQFGVSRHLLYTNGELPLKRGASLTNRQEAVLGIPDPKPGDLERLQRKTDELNKRLQGELGEASKR